MPEGEEQFMRPLTPEVKSASEQETVSEAKTEEKEELRSEGEKIYAEEFADKLDDVLEYEFKGKNRKEKIVLNDTIDPRLKEFSAEEFSQKSPEEQSEAQIKLIKDLANQISKIPQDSWSLNFRQAMENNALNCSNCATLTGLTLEKLKEEIGLQNIEYGHPYGHAINIVTLADGRIFYVDARNNSVEDLESGKNTRVEDKEGLKVYKIDRLKGGIDYKIIPVQSVKEGALSAYLGNLQGASEHEIPDVIKMRPEKEQKKFLEGAKRVYKEEGLFDEEKRQHLRKILGSFNQKLDKYEESEEFKAEARRWEVSEGDREMEGARRQLGGIFDVNEDGQKRIGEIISRLGRFLKSDLIEGDKIRQSLEECSGITQREEFVEKVFSSLAPLIELKKNNPRVFEEIQGEAFLEQGGFTKINKILSYGDSENKDFIHIHLAPAKTLRIGEKRTLIREGLEGLAKIVKENEGIKRITATSNIIAEHPKTIEGLGFTVEGEIDKKTREEHFADDDRAISRASITREEFLSKYLKEK